MGIKEFIANLKKSNFSLAVEGDKLVLKADKNLIGQEEIQAIKKNEFIINYIKENKAEIIKYLSFLPENVLSGSDSRNISAIYRLSSLQQGMLFHGLYNEGSGIYVEQFSCDITGLNKEFLDASWKYLLQRHSILRSAFYHEEFSIPVQCVFRDVQLPVDEIDLQNLSSVQQARAINDYEILDRNKGFDFKRPPLMRVALFQLDNNRHHILWTWHHILFDGWSLPILMEELLDTYEFIANGKEVIAKKEDRYEDYIRYIERIEREQEKTYWQKYMEGVEQSTMLPFINKTKERNKGIGTYKSLSLYVDAATTRKIEKYSQDLKVTLNTVMQGVWSYMLSKYTGQSDVTYGVVVSGRPDDLDDVEKRVGLYINTLPLHAKLAFEDNISTWLRNLQTQQAECRQYQHTSLQDIQSWTEIKGDLFDSLLVFENYPISKLLSSKQWLLKVENIRTHEQTNYPLNIIISVAGEITIKFLYNSDLINDTDIRKIHDHFEHVLMQLANAKAETIAQIELLTESEKKQLLDFNNNRADYPENKTVVDLFEDQVRISSHVTAVVFEDEKLTYELLNERVNQVAHYLKSKGVGQESLVPICLERSLEMIIGIMGILKAGAAYVPIDPEYPQDRIQYMLEDTSAKVVISSQQSRGKLQGTQNLEVVSLNEDGTIISKQPKENPQALIAPNNLAYVIYTSGSTGKPKGVMNEHRGIVAHLLWAQEYFRLTEADSVLQKTSFSFDVSVWELLWPLLVGARLVFAKPGGQKDNAYLKSVIESCNITMIHFVPSMLGTFLPEIERGDCTGLRNLLCSGETLKLSHLQLCREKLPHVELFNLYGPTEAAIDVTCWRVPNDSEIQAVPIGRPVTNTEIHILDKHQSLVPIGVPGELYIAGVQVARGYLNRPELSSEKFISNVLNGRSGGRLYRTGDLARWMPDGNIEYLGRIDEQVKIRGFRIELGEIEAVLQQSGFVRQSVIVAKDDNTGNKRLIAYVVPSDEFNRNNVVSYLKTKLPEYMVPAIWVEMETLPLTASGKINRKALPDPGDSALSRAQYLAPRNELENKLVNIWQELLKIERIGVFHNFFEIGGHSLSAMRLISATRRETGIALQIKDVFEFPTVAELASHISKQDENRQKMVIAIQPRPKDIPLSFSQERLWFIDQLEGSVQYHLPSVLRLNGNLNREALAQAIQNIIDRHEVLRTVILEKEGQGYQYVKNKNEWLLDITDDTSLRGNDLQLQTFINKLISKPFDLSKDHMLRAHLIGLDEDEHILVVVMHHIASDAWSFPIITREVVEFYNAAVQGQTFSTPPPQIQYADYSVWQRNFLAGERLDMSLQYWKQKLDGVQPLQLPTDLQRPAVQSTRGARAEFALSKELSQRLQTMSQQQGVTLFMTLATTLNVLLNRYSGQHDITIGTPVANRNYQELENLVGFFVNTLTLRTDLSNNPSFTNLLQQVKTSTLEAYEHQELPFEKVVDAVVKHRDISRSPLFQVMLVLDNQNLQEDITMGEVKFSAEPFITDTSKFELTFNITVDESGMRGFVEYCTDLYIEPTILRMISHFTELLNAILQTPGQHISDLKMVSDAEKDQLLIQFNNTLATYPKDKTIVDLIEEQVEKFPANIAVVFEKHQLTYRELNERSNRLAHYLIGRGVTVDSLIPICLDRTIEMIVGIVGILKAGAAYVPVDPEYPAERIAYMVEDSGSKLVVGSRDTAQLVRVSGIEVIELDDDSILRDHSSKNPGVDLQPHHLAYVIYTSGSTGRPKGVLIEHKNIVRLFKTEPALYDFNERDVWSVFHSFCFDFSVWEMYGALFYGGRMVVVPRGVTKDVSQFAELLLAEKVTVLNQTPSAFYVLQDTLIERTKEVPVRYVIFGGEALNPAKLQPWKQLYRNTKLINMYGITETTVHVTYQEIEWKHTVSGRSIIGRPIPTLTAFIVDSNRNPVPIGVAGELMIGGAGLARGYLNRPELTAERFIKNPFSNDADARLYRTGDAGAWMPDGSIEYLGRIDEQVKIRGYRIELGEIETVLHESRSLSQAVVLAKADKDGNKMLVAYVVPDGSFDREAIIAHLRKKLPDYMIPAVWIELEKLPLTPNGKIDRKALPEPDASRHLKQQFVAPSTEPEIKIAEIWKEILNVERVGVNDNFFELGGDSIKVIRVVNKLKKIFNKEVKVFDIYHAATLRELIPVIQNSPSLDGHDMRAAIREELQQLSKSLLPLLPNPDSIQDVYPMSDIQTGMVYTSLIDPELGIYHDQFSYPLVKNLNTGLLEKALVLLIEKHEIFRTAFNLDIYPEGLQVVYKSVPLKIEYINLEDTDTDETDFIKKFFAKERKSPFRVTEAPLWRFAIIHFNDRNVLVFQVHHALLDGWSVASFNTELNNLYLELLADPAQDSIAPLRVTYKDFIVESLAERKNENNKRFWINEMDGYKRLDIFSQEPASQKLNRTYSVDFYTTLESRTKGDGISLKALFFGAYLYSLSMLTPEDELTVGLVTNTRPIAEDGDKLLGCFLNTVPARVKTSPRPSSWKGYFETVENKLIELKQRDTTTLLQITNITGEKAQPENPFFDALFSFINFHVYEEFQKGLLNVQQKIEEDTAFEDDSKDLLTNTYLNFIVMVTGNVLKVHYRLRQKLKSGKSLNELNKYFDKVIDCYLNRYQEIIDRDIILSDEDAQLLSGLNQEDVLYPKDKHVVDLFEEQVLKSPTATAVVFEGETLSYQELNTRSNQLANYLRSRGVKEETRVPLCLERGLNMMIGILGILKSGAAYVPIDPEFPADRVKYMLEDTGAEILLSDEATTAHLAIESAVEIIDIDSFVVRVQPEKNPVTDLVPSNAAYIIYTSGSTGKPKGVVVEHRNLVDYVFGLNSKTSISECKSFALVSTIATDLGNTVIYASLFSGGALHLFSKEATTNVESLHEYFSENNVECLKIVPSHWQALTLDNKMLLPARLLVFGGEALRTEIVNDIYGSGTSCRVVNHYGPTETTIGKLLHPVEPGKRYGVTVPVGKPFSNTRVYVLNKGMELVPVGVPGQLFIAGDGVARGYFNKAETTREKFIPDPFSSEAGSVMYATGDMVKYLPDGNIEFIGRVDDQVKIRGYRIELGEIESVMNQCEQVQQAVVLAREDSQGNKRLVAYVVPHADFERDALISALKEKLPEYMVPSLFVELETLPLTANGKVDRKALPDPDAGELLKNQYVAPANDTESRLAAIWQDVLEVDQVGINDDFFELGGHSLLAVRLISAIRKEFAVEMPIGDIFDYPTVRMLSAQLSEGTDAEVLASIKPTIPRPEHIPLSFSQERLWFIDQLEGSVQYHVPAVLRLNGKLNNEALTHALETIVDRHETLRTVFRQEDGKPYQFVKPTGQWRLEEADSTNYVYDRAALQTYLKEIINEPFDLTRDHMIRAHLLNLKKDEHLLVVNLHHIASDGWSRSILVREVVELYSAFVENRNPRLVPLPVQYADYALWQRQNIKGEVLEKKLAYWKNKLANVEVLHLPTDYARPAVLSTRGAGTGSCIDGNITAQLKHLSQQSGTTLFMTLLAAFKVLLYRYSHQSDICVGSPIAGRQQQELEPLIGFFVNTLALRSEVRGYQPFSELLQRVKRTTLEAYEHQEVSFEKVVDEVVKERDLSRSPLTQVQFVLRNTPEIPALEFGDLALSPEAHERTTTQFDITFFATEVSDGLQIVAEYSTDLYKRQTIDQMMLHFKQLLLSIVTSPEQTIAGLQMLSNDEVQQLLHEFNNTTSEYPKHKTVVDLFEEQAASKPDNLALAFQDEELTYKELNDQSNQLAHDLRTRGVKEETLVPICIERGIEMIVSILAILKAGAAYVPIDPDYPLERIQYILSDTEANLLIGSKETAPLMKNLAGVAVMVVNRSVVGHESTANLSTRVSPSHLAYIIYTSGSTGRPKGVMIEHGSLVNYLVNNRTRYIDNNTFNSGTFIHLSYTFDASLTGIFMPLIAGKSVIIGSKQSTDVFDDENLLKYAPYDFIKVTPSHLQLLQPTMKQRGKEWLTKKLVVGGEALHLTQFDDFIEQEVNVQVINEYGPTEATVGCSTYSFHTLVDSEGLKNEISIGKPIDNMQLYILDDDQQMVPVGVVGEICIGGSGVARGYLNLPDLTGQKFVVNPFATAGDARMYRTGDLARWMPDGNIEFLGRKDDQVKIRGYRIEPGEVEGSLNDLKPVKTGCVVAQNNGETHKLISYYVPEPQAVKAKERELYLTRVASWKELYEAEYSQTEEDLTVDAEFNIIGWNDSFSGGVIPGEQMKEWLHDIVHLIMQHRPENVLEIGCGTGLIYYQLAGKVKKYIGADLSRSSVKQILNHIAKGKREYGITELQTAPAHEVILPENEEVDTIILNSMVQYFPGAEYLDDVIRKCISLLNKKGRVIIGDVRDIRLLRLFRARLQAQKLQDSVSIKEFTWAFDQDVLKEEELCISPEYFYRLQSIYPAVKHVDIQLKQGSAVNELTLYRYNVILYIGEEADVYKPDWQSWKNGDTAKSVLNQLEHRTGVVALKHVPNFRLWKERLFDQFIGNVLVNNVGQLKQATAEPDPDTPEVIALLTKAAQSGYSYRLLPDPDPLRMNILFERDQQNQFVEQPYVVDGGEGGNQFTNIPLFSDIGMVLQKEIRSLLQKQLPEYMIPQDFFALQSLPVTINGKIDRIFLGQREARTVSNKLNYEPPVTEVEKKLADIWRELLGVERIGINDNFFELGGHSLLALRVISAIRKQMGVELAIKELFKLTTINALAKFIEIQTRTFSEDAVSSDYELINL